MSSSKRKKENVERKENGRCSRFWISFSTERVSSFSLSFCAIRPLAVFGTRRKVALRGKGFSWVPDLKSFDKLLAYLGFILCLRAMLMFEVNEAVRGRLIGPKSWDRIVIIFGAIFTVHGLCAWTVWAVVS